ncbi:lysylphosphatidylglycerol synthase transmembrane domain-containing protein [Acidicapsa dinghuensis]|uniref:Lysylphosphatidylglycerol synthase transmembrane domain-containing protein n=1 Tax=Acidicapsa dinghuensis TaxID=2218256 RepID=A0ABW1EF49_9BACT|nr:lysylphosphatidylglycerol synthase transmembrane domain-containing protein [Acidicapsa dinghuensis]
MKSKKLIISIVVFVALIGFGIWAYRHVGFNFALLREQLRQVNWTKIAIGLGCIYLGYVFRGVRWAMLIRHNKRVPLFSLVGTQVIGFTSVALIGRVADLVRPYLTSKKTSLPISSQVAVYIVERLFDSGSMALIFSIAMLWVPQDEMLRAMSHSKMMASLATRFPHLMPLAARFGGIVLTALGVAFLAAVRIGGGVFASFCERTFGIFSKKLGVAIGENIRTFRSGLDTMRSWSDFLITAALSLAMWGLITVAYFVTCQSFQASPQLAGIDPSKCVLLMIVSGGASIFQLPVLGWFTQIAAVAAALAGILGSSIEASTACAVMLLAVTFLGIVPVGLIWAQFENVNLRKVATESEHAAEDVEARTDPSPAVEEA